jgi:transcriptional regulator GlxA family with amidase domain
VLIVIPPNIPVQRQLTRPIDHAHLHFSLGMPLDLYRGGIERIAAPSEIDQMMQEISTPNQTFRWRFVVSGLIDHVLASLPQSDISALQMDPRLESLLQYMHSNTHRQVLNNELAQQCHLSEPSMVRLFTKHLGRSPQAFFSDMRLDAAAALLRQIPDRSVEDIAQKTGFFDRSHFCKRFVARFGISPVAYRKSP